jgi:LysR family transcriptional regulator, hydrogen peroxide-inducible genes activator
MNLQQLEYIVALDQHKSFSRAAEICCVTQATLSTMVKRLEEELDVVLFDRKANPIMTTDAGQSIIAEAKKVLHHTHQLKHISSDVNEKVEGTLRLGVIPTVASSLLHRIVPQLLEKYPLLKLTIQEVPTRTMVKLLKGDQLDVGILSTPLVDMDLEEEILYYEKLMVYGQVKHSNTKYLSPKDIMDENIWLLEQGHCLTDQIINMCSLKSKKLHTNLSFSPGSFDGLLNMVDQLKGLTLIPELYYADLSKERKKNVRDFHSPYPVREISLVFHRPYAKQKLIRALSQEIKDIISPQVVTSTLKSREMKIAKM